MARRTSRPRPRRTPSLRVVATTLPPGRAAGIARALVAARVAACVQVVPGVRSVYRWKGRVHSDREALLLVKTTRGVLPRCLALLQSLHPYDVPEIVVGAPAAVAPAYEAWARAETGRERA